MTTMGTVHALIALLLIMHHQIWYGVAVYAIATAWWIAAEFKRETGSDASIKPDDKDDRELDKHNDDCS